MGKLLPALPGAKRTALPAHASFLLMRAIVLEEQAVYQDSRPDPVPAPGEVMVRVLQAGGYVDNRAVQLLSSNAMSNLLLRLRE